jgi:HEAT repeat protein
VFRAVDASRELTRLLDDPGAFLDHPDPALRRMAVASLGPGRIASPAVSARVRSLLSDDPEEAVRAAAAEALAGCGAVALPILVQAAAGAPPVVAEAIATALGEIADPAALPWLTTAAADHDDRLVREAAVAALGAIGDDSAVPVLVALAADAPPQVRKRAIVALSVFDGPEVEAALRAALEDRNPMVREAAEQVTGLG